MTRILPSFIVESLTYALKNWDKKYDSFIDKGLFIGIETRTSAPVRILRDKATLSTIGISNLYTIGEGSGYAGGIISSAADGVKIAVKIANYEEIDLF
jgi:hypothetical protein